MVVVFPDHAHLPLEISYFCSSKKEDEGRVNELEITIETIRIERYVYKFSVTCFAPSNVYLKSRALHGACLLYGRAYNCFSSMI